MKTLLKNKKALGIVIAAALALVAAVVFLLVRGSNGFRSIQIYRLDGTAEVRRGEREFSPYVNMALTSGDHVATHEESYLYLKMDGDKFMLAEPLTRFSLTATGTRQDSRTVIDLEIGAVTSHLTEPLSENSSYEVTTPNSTMAVRGTSFRVYVWYDEDGISHTLLMVFEGTVACRLIYPDGTMSGERLFTEGQWASIWGSSETSDYDGWGDDIDYLSLDIPTLQFLKIGIRDLSRYNITMRRVNEIIKLKLSFFDVRFMVGEQLFGTQRIQYEHFAAEPSLRPTQYGRWDYDFETPILEDTEIQWLYWTQQPQSDDGGAQSTTDEP